MAPTSEAAGAEVLQRTRLQLGLDASAADEELLRGNAAEEILRFAEEGEFDLIVLGSRTLSGIERLLLGSVSRAIVSRAPCSVMVVRMEDPLPPLAGLPVA